MTIPAGVLVSANPGVLAAGGSNLAMNGIVLSTSTRVPVGSAGQFPAQSGVEDYFGPSSYEAAISQIYFNGFDGSSVKPGNILFVQYPQNPVAAYIRGGDISGLTLLQLQAINGELDIVVDGYPRTGTFNLSTASSPSAAAGLIQTALNTSEPAEATCTLGTIASHVLTVDGVITGVFAVGQTVTGAGVGANSVIQAQATGTPGGAGTYTLSVASTVSSAVAMTASATNLTVTYDSVSGGLVITSGITGSPSLVAFATGATKTALLLTAATGAVLSQGANAAVPAAFMNSVKALVQNWASFTLAWDPDNSGHSIKLAFSAWTHAQNGRYIYEAWDKDPLGGTLVPATSTFGYALQQAGYDGTNLTYDPLADDGNVPHKAAFVAGSVASINFNQNNGRVDFAYLGQAGLLADVVDETAYANFLANGYNVYAAFATAAGKFVDYQRGSVSGKFKWLDSYANQIWFTNSLQDAILDYMRNRPNKSTPFTPVGYQAIKVACAPIIQQAGLFGLYHSGVTLSQTQISEVNAAAGGVDAASQIATVGYYLQVVDAPANVRAARGPLAVTIWYADGQSVQTLALNTVNVQ